MKKKTKIIIVAITAATTLGSLWAFAPHHCRPQHRMCGTEMQDQCHHACSHHQEHQNHHQEHHYNR